MAALQIQWTQTSRVAPEAAAVLTGENLPATPAEPAAPVRAEKPFLVYVTDPSGGGTGDAIEKIEKVILQDERVAFGARAFTCVKMTPEDAKLDPIVSKQGKEIPRFVLVSADYEKSIAFEKNRLSASTVWDGMKAAADKHYAKALDASVKEMREVLVEVDKIWAEKKTLSEKLARLEEKGTDAEKKAVEAKIAALDERQKKADETLAKVWEMKRKGEKAA
jgi:hypothetical protein